MITHPGASRYLALLREESFKLLESRLIYLYSWLRGAILPYLIMVCLGLYLAYRSRFWLLSFLLSLVSGLAYASLSIAKWPVAAIVMMIALYLLLFRSGRVSLPALLTLVCLVFAFPAFVVLMVYAGTGVGFSGALGLIFRRMFYVPAWVLYYYFEVFPEKVGYLHGASIDKLARLLGKPAFDTANYVFRYFAPEAIRTGLANAAFIGNLNADFGVAGVLLGSLLAGALVQSIQISLVRTRKTVLNLGLYVFLVYAFWLLNSTSLPVILLSNGVLILLVFPWLISACRRFLAVAASPRRSSA
jgi:hypothetical protein